MKIVLERLGGDAWRVMYSGVLRLQTVGYLTEAADEFELKVRRFQWIQPWGMPNACNLSFGGTLEKIKESFEYIGFKFPELKGYKIRFEHPETW